MCRRPVHSPLALAGLIGVRPGLDDCFNIYVDYLLESIVEPDFLDLIKDDRKASEHFSYAIHKIEVDELARWR